jgi:succinate dehydrogenase/fumarate reductase flavoprotein subunit
MKQLQPEVFRRAPSNQGGEHHGEVARRAHDGVRLGRDAVDGLRTFGARLGEHVVRRHAHAVGEDLALRFAIPARRPFGEARR